MLIRFGDDGLVSGVRVGAHGGLLGGCTVMIPWEGRFADCRPQDGMMILFQGEVAWITPDGERPCLRGAVARMACRFAD